MKCAVFLCVLLSVFAIVRCGDRAERFSELMEVMVERAEDSNIQILTEVAKQLLDLATSSEFKELSKMVDESLMELSASYEKFMTGALDGFCELKDNPDATMADVRNMLEGIKMD